jgi:hypothetical protein
VKNDDDNAVNGCGDLRTPFSMTNPFALSTAQPDMMLLDDRCHRHRALHQARGTVADPTCGTGTTVLKATTCGCDSPNHRNGGRAV